MRSVIRILLAACALALAAAPARAQSADAWRTDVPCSTATPAPGDAPAQVSHHPRPMNVAGCPAGRCFAFPDGRRVCSCNADTLIVTRVDDDGRPLNEWTDEDWTHRGDLGLSVTRADLDGDGRPELVVARLVETGREPAGQTYSVAIVAGAEPSRPPVRLMVDEYSPHGSLMRPAGGGPCRVLATRWQRLRDPARGEGTYLVGQWMRYRAGRLEHDPDHPVVVRSRESLGTDPGLGPFADPRNPHVQAWEGIPLALPPRDGEPKRGTVLQVRGDTVDLSITPQRIVQLFGFGVPSATPGQASHTFWLVDRATGRPYPSGYASGDPDWLRGAPVEFITHRDQRQAVHLVVVGPDESNPSP